MTKPFRPMLATDFDPAKLKFPIEASPKLDGVRAIVRDGVVYSRSNKPIPNQHVQQRFGWMEHYDGELIVGNPTSPSCYRDTVSGVMTQEGEPDVTFYVFDHIQYPDLPWCERILHVTSHIQAPRLVSYTVYNYDDLRRFEELALGRGFEGLILRRMDGKYKRGRSTANEGLLLKVKRFTDDEAVIIGFTEREENQNVATISELGYTKRSSHRSNKVARNDLGALVVRNSEGVTFSIGTGFTDAERAALWAKRDEYLGKIVKYKYFTVGVKEAPRHPVYCGLRDPMDLSPK